MTQYPTGPYAPAAMSHQVMDQQAISDNNNLRLLSIFHYIWGPLVMLFSSIFIIHIVLGVMMLKNPSFMAPPASPGRAAAPAPPPELGWVFIIMGSVAVFVGWTLGILNIVSGRAIAKRKWRIFSLIISGINCLSIPLGTALGIFSFVILLRESVSAAYGGVPRSGFSPAVQPYYQPPTQP